MQRVLHKGASSDQHASNEHCDYLFIYYSVIMSCALLFDYLTNSLPALTIRLTFFQCSPQNSPKFNAAFLFTYLL